MQQIKLAACVTLYHPETTTAANIKSYINAVAHLYIIDNGGGEPVIAELQPEIIAGLGTVLSYPDNAGIARPLNDVLELCQGHYDFLLTMDQDSSFPAGTMEVFASEISRFDWEHTLGIAARGIAYDAPLPKVDSLNWTPMYQIITSGSIINVTNALTIGGFNEDLFIDRVDQEFCLRGRNYGYISYLCPAGIYMRHQIGAPMVCTGILGLGRRELTSVHNHIRNYYIFRNKLYVLVHYWRLAPAFMLQQYVYIPLRELIRIVLFEPDKRRKLQAIARGVWDFLRGKMGKYDYE